MTKYHNPFANNLLLWYEHNKRELPWRSSADPYKIWLSEIILQQTRVKQGLPYFEKFVETFPTVGDLARADEQSVLRLWQGLGYYSRAKNLHACAKIILTKFNGVFPDNFEELLSLRGVGKYTAAAIASFAFDEKVAVVDGNVYRVLSRVFGLEDDIAGGTGQKKFQQFANEILPAKNTATYNQAIMEFGALQCVPANPRCEACPNSSFCIAYKFSLQHKLPVKSKKLKIKIRHLNYFVIRSQGKILMKKRIQKDIWSGLYDFHLVESEKAKEVDALQDAVLEMLRGMEKLTIEDISTTYKHVLTHQRLFAKIYLLDIPDLAMMQRVLLEANKSGSYALYSVEEIVQLPKPILIDKYLSENIF